jgi:hypothetical protein
VIHLFQVVVSAVASFVEPQQGMTMPARLIARGKQVIVKKVRFFGTFRNLRRYVVLFLLLCMGMREKG